MVPVYIGIVLLIRTTITMDTTEIDTMEIDIMMMVEDMLFALIMVGGTTADGFCSIPD